MKSHFCILKQLRHSLVNVKMATLALLLLQVRHGHTRDDDHSHVTFPFILNQSSLFPTLAPLAPLISRSFFPSVLPRCGNFAGNLQKSGTGTGTGKKSAEMEG